MSVPLMLCSIRMKTFMKCDENHSVEEIWNIHKEYVNELALRWLTHCEKSGETSEDKLFEVNPFYYVTNVFQLQLT
jgi:hypothetical protein